MVAKSLSHEKGRLSKSLDHQKEIDEHEKQEIEENYSKVSLEFTS